MEKKPKKKKRAFTLVELLAVLIILAIILLIAVPAVLEVIDDVRLNTFYRNNDLLEKATQTYFIAEELSVEEGTTIELPYTEVKDAGYIEKIVDPISKEECVSSKIFVSVENGTYVYNAALACENYMDIDDFNLVDNYNFANGTNEWEVVNSTLAVDGTSLNVTGNGEGAEVSFYQMFDVVQTEGKLIYTTFRIHVLKENLDDINNEIRNSNDLLLVTTTFNPNKIAEDEWFAINSLFEINESDSQNIGMYASMIYPDGATANNKEMEIDGVFGVYAFDLTDIYGETLDTEELKEKIDAMMERMKGE